TVTQILEHNVQYGTGTGAYFGRPAAGKTGTTDSYADAWFCGYTPNLEATVWIGYPRGEVPMLNVHGIAVSGPTFPATIWKSFMLSAIGKTRPVDFRVPSVLPTWHSFTRGQYAVGTYSPPPRTCSDGRGPGARRRAGGGDPARAARRAAFDLQRRVDVLGLRPDRGRPPCEPVHAAAA